MSFDILGSSYLDLTKGSSEGGDTSDCVKFTDIASDASTGVIQVPVSSNSGLEVINSDLVISKASTDDIDAETNNYQPLVSSNYRYAVNNVLSDKLIVLTQNDYDNLPSIDNTAFYFIYE